VDSSIIFYWNYIPRKVRIRPSCYATNGGVNVQTYLQIRMFYTLLVAISLTDLCVCIVSSWSRHHSNSSRVSSANFWRWSSITKHHLYSWHLGIQFWDRVVQRRPCNCIRRTQLITFRFSNMQYYTLSAQKIVSHTSHECSCISHYIISAIKSSVNNNVPICQLHWQTCARTVYLLNG
jgi:hypothetical protein